MYVYNARRTDYTRWEIGGEPQPRFYHQIVPPLLYPMGDRGGTATIDSQARLTVYYTRWEIGGTHHFMRRSGHRRASARFPSTT